MDSSSSNYPIIPPQPKFTSTEMFNQDYSTLDYQAEVENHYMTNNDMHSQNSETMYYTCDFNNLNENTNNHVAEGQNFYNNTVLFV